MTFMQLTKCFSFQPNAFKLKGTSLLWCGIMNASDPVIIFNFQLTEAET